MHPSLSHRPIVGSPGSHLLRTSTACLALVALVGCRSAPRTPCARPSAPASAAVTSSELRTTGVSDLYTALKDIRPGYLRSRTASDETGPVVYVDGVRMGTVDVLRTVPVSHVVEVRSVRASDATTRFGTDHAGGALLVMTAGGTRSPCA